MRVNAMVDGELMGFEGDAAKVIKARDDEIGVLRHVIEALEGVMAERKPIAISRECADHYLKMYPKYVSMLLLLQEILPHKANKYRRDSGVCMDRSDELRAALKGDK